MFTSSQDTASHVHQNTLVTPNTIQAERLGELEDLVTSSRDSPEVRAKAQELVDKARELRRNVEEMRIEEEIAKRRLQKTI
jgi:hypothetical protein